MKNFKSILFLLLLLMFLMSLEMCTTNATSYCQKANQNINWNKNKIQWEKSSSDVFPDNDLIIKI
jgi:hypothetical protein